MKKTAVKILSALLMLSMVFSSNVFAAEKTNSAWDSFVGLFGGNVTTAADTQVDGVTYQTHIQNEGWAQGWVSDGTMSGSEGKGLRLEGLEVKIDHTKLPADLGITYQTQIQNDGWAQGWVSDGTMSGSEGKGLRLEAVQIKLTGASAGDYSVGYKTHIQNKGWETDWSYNGDTSGTVGEGLRLEAIEIEIFKNIPDLTAYNAALAAVNQADYTTASWTAYQAVVKANVVTTDNLVSEVDAATANITAAQASLVLVPKVTSVTAINAKTLVVTFNSALDPATVVDNNGTTTDLTDDNLVNGAITVTSLDSHAVTINNAQAELSADNKTLTLVVPNAEYFSGRYDVKVPAGAIKTPANDAVQAYSTTIDVKDTVAPTILSTTSVTASTVKVVFSEPMMSLGNMSFALSDGTVVAGIAPGVSNDYNVNTNNRVVTFTLGTAIAANKNVVATIVGAEDFAGNLLTPNPATITLHKGDKDGIAPTVSSIKFLNATTLEVNFSEELAGLATTDMAVNGSAPTKITQDTTDKMKYTATLGVPVSGIVDVSVFALHVTDLSGEPMAADYTTSVIVSADTTAPTLTSATIVTGTDNAQYLDLKFSEDVAKHAGASFTFAGTQTTDYVTTAFTSAVATANVVAVPNTTNEFRIALSNFAAAALVEGTSYTLDLPANLVQDTSLNSNILAAGAIVFTRGADGVPADYTYQTVDTVTQDTNDSITVVFGSTVDGASATNKANYTVQGTTISSANLAADRKTVTLNLVKDSTTYSGNRYITINNVLTAALVNLETAYNAPVDLTENVRPTLVSALRTGVNTITLTFSEDVALGANGDFDVYFNGVADANNTITAAPVVGNAKKVTLTTDGTIDATALAAGITVEKAAGNTVEDVNGNALNMPSAVTVTLN